MQTARADQLARELNAQREGFKAFLTARVGSAEEAEDILQNGLLKAVQRAGELQDDAKLTAWFYQLLRNAIVDHYRARGSRRRRASDTLRRDDSTSARAAATFARRSSTCRSAWAR